MLKGRFDEGHAPLRIVMGEAVEMRPERIDPRGLIAEPGPADLAPGPHPIGDGQGTDTRNDVVISGTGLHRAARRIAISKDLVAPAHQRVLAFRHRAHKSTPDVPWGRPLGKGLFPPERVL